MNRKHNPIVALVALALLAVLLFCAGRDSTTETSPRFIVEDVKAKTQGAHQHVNIITDTETGMQYIFFKSYNSGGLTVLQPAAETEEDTK